MTSRYPPETPEPTTPRGDPTRDPTYLQRDGGTREDASGGMGATEDDVLRGDDATTPEVTDMGLDERGRDQPDGGEFGRGEMPDQLALGDTSDTGGRPDAPRYGRSPRQGLGGAGAPDETNGSPGGEAPRGDPNAVNTPTSDTVTGATSSDTIANNAANPDRTASGTLAPKSTLGESTGGPFGGRGDGGGGMLNAEIPASMAGAGPLGGSPARGDTMDAVADRRKYGINAPSSSGSRDVHLGVGHNSATGESTPGMHPTSPGTAGAPGGGTPARADTSAAERDLHQMGAPGRAANATSPDAERQPGQSSAAGKYPRRATETDLPTGSGTGGSRPHLDPRLNHLPGEIGKEGRP